MNACSIRATLDKAADEAWVQRERARLQEAQHRVARLPREERPAAALEAQAAALAAADRTNH